MHFSYGTMLSSPSPTSNKNTGVAPAAAAAMERTNDDSSAAAGARASASLGMQPVVLPAASSSAAASRIKPPSGAGRQLTPITTTGGQQHRNALDTEILQLEQQLQQLYEQRKARLQVLRNNSSSSSSENNSSSSNEGAVAQDLNYDLDQEAGGQRRQDHVQLQIFETSSSSGAGVVAPSPSSSRVDSKSREEDDPARLDKSAHDVETGPGKNLRQNKEPLPAGNLIGKMVSTTSSRQKQGSASTTPAHKSSPFHLTVDQDSNYVDSLPLMRPSRSKESSLQNSPGSASSSLYAEQFAFHNRAMWLIGLLLLQSSGSAILANYSKLLMKHPSIVYFSTMLVGAGGNAGGQSVVYVVRKFAERKQINNLELLRTAALLGLVIGVFACLRFLVQHFVVAWPHLDTAFVLSFAASIIVFVGALLGAVLPQLFLLCRIDPAHASATIQVVMDLVALSLVCFIAHAFLGDDPTDTGGAGAVDYDNMLSNGVSAGGASGAVAGTTTEVFPQLPGKAAAVVQHPHKKPSKHSDWDQLPRQRRLGDHADLVVHLHGAPGLQMQHHPHLTATRQELIHGMVPRVPTMNSHVGVLP